MYALHFRICVEVLAFNDYNLHAVLNSQSMKLSSIPEITGMSIYLRSQNSQTFKDLSWINNFHRLSRPWKRTPNFPQTLKDCRNPVKRRPANRVTRQPDNQSPFHAPFLLPSGLGQVTVEQPQECTQTFVIVGATLCGQIRQDVVHHWVPLHDQLTDVLPQSKYSQ